MNIEEVVAMVRQVQPKGCQLEGCRRCYSCWARVEMDMEMVRIAATFKQVAYELS